MANSFLRRVRIHGGEFGASARAMHRNAELGKVPNSTIERKQMSTKTTFKRVALVAVAALGFGVLSVVPSNAVINADSLTLSSATAAQTTAETSTATSAVATMAFLGAAGDSVSVTASLVSGPAGSTALPYIQLSETSSALVDSNTAAGALTVNSIKEPNVRAVVYASGSTAVLAASAKFKVYLGKDSITAPSVVGTYVVKLTPAAIGSGTLQGATAQTLTITVTAAAALDTVATSATAYIRPLTDTVTALDAVLTADKGSLTAARTYTDAAAVVKVTLKNAAGTSLGTASNAGESFTATITGAGQLGSDAWPLTSSANPRGRAITVKAGDYVAVYSDGTSGVGTVTISSKAGVVLSTKTITFFGAATSIVAKAEATVLNPGASNADAISVVVKDAAGTNVSNLTLRVTGETSTIVTDSYASGCTWDSTDLVYYCAVNGGVAGKTKVTVGMKTSAADTTATNLNAAPVEMRVGTTTAADVKVSLDKSSYAPGEKMTLTVQLVDADGLVVGDGTYTNIFAAGGITSDFVLGTGSDTTTASTVHGAVGGKKTYTLYAPQNSGAIKFTYTTAGTAVTGSAPSALSGLAVANQAVTRTFTATVSNPAVDAATDAANEATDAANAATDAANAAAEAADAATAAAQDAADAVAALSTQVNELISALRKQITSLTAIVLKIQKKVKA